MGKIKYMCYACISVNNSVKLMIMIIMYVVLYNNYVACFDVEYNTVSYYYA